MQTRMDKRGLLGCSAIQNDNLVSNLTPNFIFQSFVLEKPNSEIFFETLNINVRPYAYDEIAKLEIILLRNQRFPNQSFREGFSSNVLSFPRYPLFIFIVSLNFDSTCTQKPEIGRENEIKTKHPKPLAVWMKLLESTQVFFTLVSCFKYLHKNSPWERKKSEEVKIWSNPDNYQTSLRYRAQLTISARKLCGCQILIVNWKLKLTALQRFSRFNF